VSSSFGSFGGAPTSFCQCCHNPLSPNIVQCGYCGYDNSPMQHNGQNAPVPQTFYNAFPDYGQVNNALSPAFMTLPQTPEIQPATTEERHTLNMKKVVGLIVVLLVLIGGCIAGGYGLLTSQQRANTPPSVPATYPIPKGSPLFAETFMNNSKQWNMQSMQGRYLVSMKKGNLLLEDDDNKILPVLLPTTKNFSDFKLIVDAQLSKGDKQNGYGLCLRGATDSHGYLTAYYRIEVYGNGAYAVSKVATDVNGNTSSTTLVEPTVHPAIKPAGHNNQIALIAKGPKITLVVNGQTVQTFSDTSYTTGVIALFVSNLPGTHPGAQATFSHLAIYPVNAK
jgi:hypothetical protein